MQGSNDKVTVVNNNNFNKMADSTLSLFEEEAQMFSEIDENVVETLEETDNEVSNLKESVSKETTVSKEENKVSKLETVIKTYTGILTGYGPDCVGCGNFKTKKVKTASGYHIANIVGKEIEPAFRITYNDKEYGEVRIVAADSDIPFYSIVRITVPKWKEPITAIVLDRGSTVGFDDCRSSKGCLTNFDLLYPTEKESLGKTKNVKFEILRNGK